MPNYRLRYICESSLQFAQDVSFGSGAHPVVFLFSQKDATNTVRARVDIEAANYREADIKVQSVLQPALDALSFSTGTPLLVQNWDFILKGEAGGKTRRAIWCERAKEPAPHNLTQREIDEVQSILSQEGESLELCWHRYALQRSVILDRFVFQWLAFEALAGKKLIPTICPHCKEEVGHCEKPLLHEGSDGTKAYELFSRVDPQTSPAEFKRDIWGKARNSVFHGKAYPNPKLLSRLNAISPKLRSACDSEFNRNYELRNQPRPARDIELHVYRTNMFEWETAHTQDEFAEDFPWEAVTKEFGGQALGEVRTGFPDKWPFKLLDYARDSLNW